MRQVITTVAAVTMLLLSSIRVSAAQEIVTLPAGGIHRIGIEALETQLGVFDAVAVTLLPKSSQGVMYLDGKRIEPYRILTRGEASRVLLFSSEKCGAVSFGAVPFGGQQATKQNVLRVRCINRRIL